MKQFISLLYQLLFWMLFFALQRALFLAYYYHLLRLEEIPFGEMLLTFFYALKLDLSTASYILLFPFLLLLVQSFGKMRWLNPINKIYTLFILLVYTLISVSELGLYKEWHTKLNYKALVYLQRPGEILNTVPNWDIVFLFSLVLLQIVVFYFVYQKYFYTSPNYTVKEKIPAKIFFALIVPGLLVLGIRGGFGQIPITVSQSYFSQYNILNQASVNPGYNITFNIIDYYQVEERNIFHFMPGEEAQQIVRELHVTEKDTTIRIINRDRPNIIIILLESWSGDLIETLGGKPGLTPEFHELEKEGLFFTEFYATGNRSQQALASIFSGLPALPLTTLTDHPGKYDALPSMIKMLKEEGYYSSFFFGGDLNYGNIKSYLIYNQFDRLVEETDFAQDAIKGKLGVHDEGLFDKMLDEIGDQPEPFFTAALTLSSHSPYDQPGERPIDWIELENKYVNSAWYTDKCLGDFFRRVKEKPWYDNTLFIILSDHSHPSYNNYQWWSFRFRHIPLLFLGGALSEQYINVKSNHLSSNMDLTSTILKQLNLVDEPFFWSKNIFNPYSPQFAYLELNEGFGWKRPEMFLEYKIVGPMVLHTDVPKQQIDSFRKEGEAYIQVLFKEFLEY